MVQGKPLEQSGAKGGESVPTSFAGAKTTNANPVTYQMRESVHRIYAVARSFGSRGDAIIVIIALRKISCHKG